MSYAKPLSFPSHTSCEAFLCFLYPLSKILTSLYLFLRILLFSNLLGTLSTKNKPSRVGFCMLFFSWCLFFCKGRATEKKSSGSSLAKEETPRKEKHRRDTKPCCYLLFCMRSFYPLLRIDNGLLYLLKVPRR